MLDYENDKGQEFRQLDRNDLKNLAQVRVREARILLEAGEFAGAYYLSGYAIECGLKACIAKQTRKHEFPDRERVRNSYTHELATLVRTAGRQSDLQAELERDPGFEVNWGVVKDWSEAARYRTFSELEARNMYDAVTDRNHGVLRWIRHYWSVRT